MTLNKLASLIAFREGKKHQASVGDVREILSIIVELERVAWSCADTLWGEYPSSVFEVAAQKRPYKRKSTKPKAKK